MEKIQQQTRDHYWDNLKFALITLVVIGHFAAQVKSGYLFSKELFVYIYSFHMPAFIFVSGIFSKSVINNRGNRFKIEKVISYLVLYLAYKIMIYLMYMIAYGESSFRLMNAGGLEWYMLFLAISLCILYVIKDVKPEVCLVVSIILGVLVGFEDQLIDVLALSRVIVYFPFFYIGYILDRNKVTELLKSKAIRSVGILITIIWLAFVFLNVDAGIEIDNLSKLFSGHNPYSIIAADWESINWVYRLVYYPVVAVITFAFMCCIPNVKLPLITRGGGKTLQIYFIHRPLIYVLMYVDFFGILQSVFGGYWQYVMVLAAIATTFILSVNIFSKPFDFIMSRKYKWIFKESCK